MYRRERSRGLVLSPGLFLYYSCFVSEAYLSNFEVFVLVFLSFCSLVVVSTYLFLRNLYFTLRITDLQKLSIKKYSQYFQTVNLETVFLCCLLKVFLDQPNLIKRITCALFFSYNSLQTNLTVVYRRFGDYLSCEGNGFVYSRFAHQI